MASAAFSTFAVCNVNPTVFKESGLQTRQCTTATFGLSITKKKTQGLGICAILLPSAAGENFRYHESKHRTLLSNSITDQGSLMPSLVGKMNVTTLIQQEQTLQQPSSVEEFVLRHFNAETIEALVYSIKESLACLIHTDGEVSVSAYDTAFVARISSEHDVKKPQFPKSLEWIVANQHPDGSWGDTLKDWIYDRMNQTLACVVALKFWNYCDDCVQKGVEYINLNAHKLESEDMNRMPIGFEVAFTAMLSEAKSLGLRLPYDIPFLHLLQKTRNRKLERVPLELLHSQPTTMLHNLEGIQSLNIDWQGLLKFQADDGSICCSPSSTAVVYMHTRNPKCLSFLIRVLEKFENAVPTVYPLDIFHNLWVVDTLERLGIARYFSEEIDRVLATVYKHWSDEQGICWARVLKDVPDLDDSSMAFRLLRQHGYKVSADAFEAFYKDNAFACFAVGQMVQGVSDMLNLYRASQLTYPGETRLDEALTFSRRFLVDALNSNKGNADKWCLKKDLAGEIEYALKYPEYKNLKRLEIREYLDKYGPDDCWIGKTIYRLRLVNNPEYLALAKADFNMCQMLHQHELRRLLRWISDSGLSDSRSVRERIVMFYVMFSAEVWEPELSAVRISASKCLFIVLALHQLFSHPCSVADLKQFHVAIKRWDASFVSELPENFQACYKLLSNTLQDASMSSLGQDLAEHLTDIWDGLVDAFLTEAEWKDSKTIPTMDEYWNVASSTIALDATAWSSMLISGVASSEEFSTWKKRNCPFFKKASQAIRLAQGLAAYKQCEHMQDHASMFRCFLEENKSSTMQGAVDHFENMRKSVQKELSRYRDPETTLSPMCKKVVISFTKVANFYYDGEYERECNHGLQRLMVCPLE
ncbi:hypothetical protein R1sor_001285 [Riccia sorocarpa]|uniref:Uncharacterized protein n=1 Tax=Riccia sorocarpa TaxID=122646 RepID=A0ABD3GVV4_9MARC